ncbi:hypothetical protein [Pararhizobium sp. DWP3-4]|uniref:hypothetical protein n=1 Tax=Pararhizobium sp. DWP3-4 TaxID=2804565 RepID=UPI003CF976A0
MAGSLEKGYRLEELLRAYFLRSSVYVVRGVPLQFDGEDMTDVDLWLYERPTGSSRRRQIVDAKSRNKPKAIERLLWTKGLKELLDVDGAYIATTDRRPILKEMSRRLGVSVLDGADLARMGESDKILFPDRLDEEDLNNAIRQVDRARRTKDLQLGYLDLKSALVDQFGAGTVNRALDHFSSFLSFLTSSHPSGDAAGVALRLCFLAASIAAVAMDFSLAKVSFKSGEERKKALLNVIRYGDEDEARGLAKVRVAAALVEQYAPNGGAVARAMTNAIRAGYDKIPAEIISDHVLNHLRNESLFKLARDLEFRAFTRELAGFDSLSLDEKAYLGALIDFVGGDRRAFAGAWHPSPPAEHPKSANETPMKDIGPLI